MATTTQPAVVRASTGTAWDCPQGQSCSLTYMNKATQRASKKELRRANRSKQQRVAVERPRIKPSATVKPKAKPSQPKQVRHLPGTATRRTRYTAPVMTAEQRAAYDAYFSDIASMNDWRDQV